MGDKKSIECFRVSQLQKASVWVYLCSSHDSIASAFLCLCQLRRSKAKCLPHIHLSKLPSSKLIPSGEVPSLGFTSPSRLL